MIIINVKDNESVDRALKRFKKKFERTGVLKELRSRAYFEKPSISKRKQKERAVYKQQMFADQNY
ncbi:30S ribosomal protein S21 [Pontibacter sp. E15-1]|uniref:30S ribosomal protein S21 n=1 Tax=Pontibacter sp. E15-1 TaxID=2919918 RepID=UPI001F502AAF|nr:30S ribosomal protein S21 [Pontibacter sp. E15-1]MCJ8166983.1 30S ribosomal protein S21 [Pontibacter sp. E15-1]